MSCFQDSLFRSNYRKGGATEVAQGVFTESLFAPRSKPGDLGSHSPGPTWWKGRNSVFKLLSELYMHVVAPSASYCKRMNERMNFKK